MWSKVAVYFSTCNFTIGARIIDLTSRQVYLVAVWRDSTWKSQIYHVEPQTATRVKQVNIVFSSCCLPTSDWRPVWSDRLWNSLFHSPAAAFSYTWDDSARAAEDRWDKKTNNWMNQESKQKESQVFDSSLCSVTFIYTCIITWVQEGRRHSYISQ